MAEHGIGLVKLIDLGPQLDESPIHVARDLGNLGLAVRQELVKRRVEQADRYRCSGELTEDAFKVAFLERQKLIERLAPAGFVARENHLPHAEDAFLGEEHVLGATET